MTPTTPDHEWERLRCELQRARTQSGDRVIPSAVTRLIIVAEPVWSSILNSQPVPKEIMDDLATMFRDFARMVDVGLAFPYPPLPPETREWALRQAPTDEQMLAGIKDVQENGSTELGDVIQKLKQKRKDRERTKP